MYLDDWLIQVTHWFQCECTRDLTLKICHQMGFLYNLVKPNIMWSQSLVWLGIQWDSRAYTHSLSDDSWHRVLTMAHCTLVTWNITRLTWESLMGCLIYVAEVVPLSWICHHRRRFEDNLFFTIWDEDQLVPYPSHLCPVQYFILGWFQKSWPLQCHGLGHLPLSSSSSMHSVTNGVFWPRQFIRHKSTGLSPGSISTLMPGTSSLCCYSSFRSLPPSRIHHYVSEWTVSWLCGVSTISCPFSLEIFLANLRGSFQHQQPQISPATKHCLRNNHLCLLTYWTQ